MAAQPVEHLAATKLRPPVVPTRLVERTRLAAVIDEAVGDHVPLVLVSAPAGSGKSTLVAAWAAARTEAVAWLQLEESDADPARFWVSVVAAIGRSHSEVAERLAPIVAGSAGAGPVVVPALVNELESSIDRIAVVLDDYHLVDADEVHRAIERLIELCPRQLTLVLLTRSDPPFRLGRLRVRDRVREVRADDLRFDPVEAAALLGAAAGSLSSERLADLCERTEGWAAGLVLAGLSLARTTDADRFVAAFHGDDRLVAGYLTDELLAVVGDDERERMVEAAVLHRISGPLLDAVTGSSDGAEWLDALASRNQLLIRLDSSGGWYRYHHLFREMLLVEAERTLADRLPELHRRAAAWFEAAGYAAAAVDHRLAAGDRGAAMHLMRIVGPDLLGSGQLRTLRNILARLADGGELDTICLLLSGWDHYLAGRYDTAQHLLDRALAIRPDDVEPMRAMPLRINLALGVGDVATALAAAREVLAAGDLAARPSELTTAVGAALAWAGACDDARATLALALVRTKEERRITAHAMALVALALAEFQHETADRARLAARRALDHAAVSGLGEYHGIAPALMIHVVTGPLDADTAAQVDRAVVLARRATTTLGLVFVLALAGDVLARLDDERGHALIDEADALSRRCADPGINRSLIDQAMARHRRNAVRVAVDDLVEQLSEREQAVLRFLPSSLSLPEIARELYVSPNTVKTQCSAIYRKLGVNSRSDAVRTARDLRLI